MSVIDLSLKITGKRPCGYSAELNHGVESDRGRIINCAAIRRLQQKTQVFLLERNGRST